MPTEIHNHRDRKIGANFAGLSLHEIHYQNYIVVSKFRKNKYIKKIFMTILEDGRNNFK